MHPSQHTAGIVRLVLGTSLAAILLAGCGNENGSGASEPAGASSAPMPDTMNAPVVEASTLAVPPDGPTTITEFPVPAGAQIIDLGPPIGGNWQFALSAPDAATTLEFYKRTLAAQGYTLRQNASITVGVNTVEFDLAFFGSTYGVVDRNTLVGGVQVTVDARPIRGLEP